MKQFTKLTSNIVPLAMDNVDTDQIIPAQFLKITTKEGLGDKAFFNLKQDPDFVINQPAYKNAKILVVGDNFGCGSSREHAPWSLIDYGFEVIIAESFADIFHNNSLKNGLLTIELPKDVVKKLRDSALNDPSTEIAVDLENENITTKEGEVIAFHIDAFRKNCLLRGVDDLGYLLSFKDKIEAYEGETPVKGLTES